MDHAQPDRVVYTIGHSTHPMEVFVGLLNRAGITAVADVRSTPYSRWQPQYNREALRSTLADRGVAYVFLGAELGGRGDGDSPRDGDGRIMYRRLAESPAFREGVRRVLKGMVSRRVALMCTEADPLRCHRGILIARELTEADVRVAHIHGDGRLEGHGDAERRLLRLAGLAGPDLLRDERETLADAYGHQESRIAHVLSRG